jgi:glycosyltransferase involved in cell wall biosynthesis
VPLNPLPDRDVVPGRLVVIGSDNPINVRSIDGVIHNVLPQIRRELPFAELAVAGRVCSEIDNTPGVRLLGRVEDFRTAYASARVAINPALFGTGLKIKSIEALGHARALVTTPCGAAGLSEGAQTAFAVESDPEAFASRVIDLLANEQRASSLGNEAFRFAEKYNHETQVEIENLFGRGCTANAESSGRVIGFP